MLIFASVLCLAAMTGLCATVQKAKAVRREEARMSGYIASLKAVAADHRARISELEGSLSARDQMLQAQERLLEGQAAHLRTLDARYVG